MQSLPVQFTALMEALLGHEFPSFINSLDSQITGLRTNTLNISPEILRELLPYQLESVPWSKSGFWISEIDDVEALPRPGRLPYHAAGLFYIQDPTAMVVAELLQPLPGELILDLCAAPGGKTTHISSLMGNRGTIIANEIHPGRVWELAENLARCGVRNTIVTNDTPERLSQRFGPIFDRVLVDAPCSGEAMFAKSETARREWSMKLVESCSLRQSTILEQAANLVRPGGILAYSTCTFNPIENETVVARFVQNHTKFRILDGKQLPGSSNGRPDWLGKESAFREIEYAIRLWPHLSPGDGHFVVVLQRMPEESYPGKKHAGYRPCPKPEADIFADFCNENLRVAQSKVSGSAANTGNSISLLNRNEAMVELQNNGRIVLVRDRLYLIPEIMPDLAGLRVIHPGWWLGTIRQGDHNRFRRFEPSHSLAMALKADDCVRSTGWRNSDPEVIDYLRGKTFPSMGEKGWVLSTVDSFSLGWAKRVGNILKNHYPRGLRWN
ncbi:MAG: hypothetical protein A2Z16_07675 [Chloroflexi bacterium RBG_16_54_18]|nr:MAG: hypothetical protein A2Z16_07675 [Chloroflexi bacterium RBG_16_54_18]